MKNKTLYTKSGHVLLFQIAHFRKQVKTDVDYQQQLMSIILNTIASKLKDINN